MKNKIYSLLFLTSALGFGSAQAAYVNVNDATGNNSQATAFNLNNYFDQSFDANINSPGGASNVSTSFFHASVNNVQGNIGKDWYSFNVTSANTQAYFDIDFGMPNFDSWLNLYDATGALMAQTDDSSIEAGSVHGYDSFLSTVFTNPGLYFIQVARYPNSDLNPGNNYTLHVSLSNPPVATPVPAAVWLFSSALMGMLGLGRKGKVKA